MRNNLLLFYTLFLMSSCSPRITTSLIKKEKSLSKNAVVTVYDKNDTLPAVIEKLGTTPSSGICNNH